MRNEQHRDIYASPSIFCKDDHIEVNEKGRESRVCGEKRNA